jgi:uncharacterized damage-inducible protein DinB
MRETFADLFAHMEWADALVWTSVIGAAHPVDAKTKATLLHLHVVQRAFHSIWIGATPEFRDEASFDLHRLMEWGKEGHSLLRDYLAALPAESLTDVVVLPWASQISTLIGPDPGPTTRGETLLQVVLHSTYHRGQVNARLKEQGIDPPLTDFIAWLWLKRGAPSWPS